MGGARLALSTVPHNRRRPTRRFPLRGVSCPDDTRSELVTWTSWRALAIRAPPRTSNNHIGLAAAAFGADQPLGPIENRRLGAVSLRLLGGIGFDLIAAILAPDDEANAGSSRAA